jgi:hypothetical protein
MERKVEVRLDFLTFPKNGGIHKKVGSLQCGLRIAKCGIQNTKNRVEQRAKRRA